METSRPASPASPVQARGFGPSALATPANALTLARLLLTPAWLWLVLTGGASWPAFGVGFVLAVTDAFDGILARRQGSTRSGAFLDPLADKFFVLGGLVVLVVDGVFWWLPVAAIAAREVAMSAYRSWVGRHGVSVPARWLAKVKTVVQELAIGAALLPPLTGYRWVAVGLLWAGVALALFTGVQYLLDARRPDPASA